MNNGTALTSHLPENKTLHISKKCKTKNVKQDAKTSII